MIKPFWSIVTPTLQRESLIRCCDSISSQSTDSWEHLVMVDCAIRNEELLEKIAHPQRRIMQCGPYRNYGNSPRNLAWQFATGIYQYALDDDNFLADQNVLEDLQTLIIAADYPDWGCVPIRRHGQHFFYDPPRSCYVDTGNIYAKREIARWPNRDEYVLDGIWVETLAAHVEYSYKAFPDMRPIMIMETSGRGE